MIAYLPVKIKLLSANKKAILGVNNCCTGVLPVQALTGPPGGGDPPWTRCRPVQASCLYNNSMLFICSRLALIFLLFFIFFGLPLKGLGQDNPTLLDELFTKYHRYEDFEGAVLVAENGQTVYQQAFGLANREWDIPNHVDTKFNLASLSKQFTAALVLLLAEEKKIELDSSLSHYYPAYRPDVGTKVTVHQLLTHTSGIPNYTSLPAVWTDSLVLRYTPDELVEKFGSMDLEFEPGTGYQYNNTGYFLLSILIEKVTGQPFEQVLQEKILTPLGMNNTDVDDRSEIIKHRAYGYVKNLEGYTNASPMYMKNLQGAGNMYSTVEDLLLWNNALYGGKLLSKKSLQLMTEAHTQESDGWIAPYPNSYGYGLGIATLPAPSGKGKSLKMYFHSGHISGFSSFMVHFPESHHTIILLSNTGGTSTSRMNEITQEAKNILYGLPYQMPQRALSSTLLKVTREEGVEAAIKKYHYLVSAFPYDYADTENELDKLATDLFTLQQPEAAFRMLELNAAVNPSWETYLYLARACHAKDEITEALNYYKKSLNVNPAKTDDEKKAKEEAKKNLKELKKDL